MPDSLPAIPGAKVVRALERAGFTGRENQWKPSHDAPSRRPDGRRPRTCQLRHAQGNSAEHPRDRRHDCRGVPAVPLSLGFQNGAWLADLRVFLLRWPRGWQDRGLVTARMLYLILIRMVGWMALLARCAAADDAGLPV